VRLGNVVDYGSSDKAESADIPEDAWLLDLEDIEKDTSRLLQRKSFRDSPSKSTKTAFTIGDVLYGKLRPYLNKVIVADAPGYCTTEIIPIRAFGFIEPAYLCYALKRPEFIAYANSKSYGMNLPRLGTEDARSAPFPLPPFAEQKRIVAKVDELMALCDRLEAQQQERETRYAALARASLTRFADAPTPGNLRFLFHDSYTVEPVDLRKATSDLAIQGLLGTRDLRDEPGLDLLARIKEEKVQLVRQGEIKHAMLEASPALGEDARRWPDNWAATTLGELAHKITDGAHKTPNYVTEGIPFVSVKDFSAGRLDFSSTRFISPDEHAVLFRRCDPRRGDILIGRIGTLGKAVVVDVDFEFSLFVSVGLIRCSQQFMVPAFLRLLLNSPYVEAQFDRIKIGGATHTNKLNLGDLYSLRVPLPPLAEQRRIVDKAGQLMTLVDQLEKQLTASSATAEKLVEAVVAELTAQEVVQ
jgi:type I restriction enzyme S subunit